MRHSVPNEKRVPAGAPAGYRAAAASARPGPPARAGRSHTAGRACGGHVLTCPGGTPNEFATTAARTADLLVTAAAQARTAANAAVALDDALVRSEVLAATMARLAQQTGRVALNASIQAARAGEVGREFAVVAEALRRLADEGNAAASAAAVAAADARAEAGYAAASTHQAALGINDARQCAASLAELTTDVAVHEPASGALRKVSGKGPVRSPAAV